ncbi:TPA: head-tail adaptor protein [Vibrio cholerae]|nr:head-tail adaptor protein [Vibrio cholerae]
MRIGMMREQIEVWKSTESINQYGITTYHKELYLACPAGVKHLSNSVDGGLTKSHNTSIEFTIRNNRYYSQVGNNSFIKWDNKEYDIVGNNNHYSHSKYITLVGVLRGK